MTKHIVDILTNLIFRHNSCCFCESWCWWWCCLQYLSLLLYASICTHFC